MKKLVLILICIFMLTFNTFGQSEEIKLYDTDSMLLQLDSVFIWANPESDTLRDRELINEYFNCLNHNFANTDDSTKLGLIRSKIYLSEIFWSIYDDRVKKRLLVQVKYRQLLMVMMLLVFLSGILIMKVKNKLVF